MKTRSGILILTACGCLTLGGAIAYAAETPAAAIAAKDLKTQSEADKLKAVDDLAARGEKAAEAVKAVEDLLKDKSPKVRAHAALALGAMQSKALDCVPALAELMKDTDDGVRRSALRAIRTIHPGPKVMIPLCTKLLEDPDPAIRGRILNAIAERGIEAVPPLIEALKDEKAAFWALIVLRDIGPVAKDAIPAITEKLKDKRADIRREAVLTLGAMGDEQVRTAVPQITALLSDPAAGTAATFVLGQLGQIPKDAEATVRSNAKSGDPMLSTTSLWALARVHPEDKDLRKEATEKLVAGLKDKNEFVRVAAARGLAALPPAPEITLPIWEKALKDADEATLRNAMDALAALGPQAVPRLIKVLKHEKYRAEVVYALGRIGPAAEAATDELAKLVDDKNSRVAQEAIIALGNIGPAASRAVPALIKALQQADETDFNLAAIEFALGKIGPGAASAESELLKELGSKDENVRVLSGWALAQIDPKSADVATKAVPVLIAGLTLPEQGDRLFSAEGLEGFGPLAKSAEEGLKKATTDANKYVKEEAAKALKALERPVPAVTAPSAATTESPAAPSAAVALKPGDFVVTVEEQVEIGVKGSQGDTVAKGTRLKVLEIRGKWIGVRIDGKTKTGWVLGEQIGRP
jgi:HEAT repeat protein